MTIKELIKMDFGVDLPISGGFGNSIDSPIIIYRTDLNDYVGTEHFILKCLGKGRRIEWKIIEQTLLNHNGKKIDKIKIETKQTTEIEIITQIENYYFDISECFGEDNKTDTIFNEKTTLEKIKNRMLELQSVNDFNKKCIDLIKKGELFKDSKLTMEFLDVISKDESITLFDDMMNNKRKTIMDVLRIIGTELNENHS